MIAKGVRYVKKNIFINVKINYQQFNTESLQLVTKQWFARIFNRNYRNVNDSTISLARDAQAFLHPLVLPQSLSMNQTIL